MGYEDAGHRPHAVHTGEAPENHIDRGPNALRVTLDTWGPKDNLFCTIYDALQSNWGDAPNRSVNQPCRSEYAIHNPFYHTTCAAEGELDRVTGWCRLTDGQRDYVESCFQGKTLNQILELITFEFTVSGCSRAFTHQFVRTRIGAGFMQHGGRDNDWRHRPWTMPETIARACDAHEVEIGSQVPGHTVKPSATATGLKHCIQDWKPIEKHIRHIASENRFLSLREVIDDYLLKGRELYAALVDAGIPWQDARRLLWMGTQTYIHGVYNYLALQGVASKRLETAMDWEINCVAQLMVREVRTKCHPLIGKYLQSLSDKLGVAAFAGLESWTPSGQYANPFEVCNLCHHSRVDHTNMADGWMHCTKCEEVGDKERGWPMGPTHIATFRDTRPRTHRPEQSPFFVLHPDSMAGGPIVWIPTNGVFPKDF